MSFFYKEKNTLIKRDTVTVDLWLGNEVHRDELILYEGRSHMEAGMFHALVDGRPSDSVIAGMKGKRIAMDVTDKEQYIMVSGVKYEHIRSIVGDDGTGGLGRSCAC